jgi:CheY-like chemotaxis protein
MNPTFLIVDDDEDDHLFFTEALLEVNAKAILLHAANGLQAIRILQNGTQNPQFIFSDLNMPLMNGIEFLIMIKKEKLFSEIPIYILTTSINTDARQEALAAGAAGFFSKPPRIEDLKKILKTVLQETYDI